MKILLVSATYKEIEGLLKTFETIICFENKLFRGFSGNRLVDILVTGVGSVATVECLSQRLESSKYDLILNVGICGSFRKNKSIGSVVNIVSETWGDLGAEDHDEFLDLFDLGINKTGEKPFTGKGLLNRGSIFSSFFKHIPEVKGITVNKAHGSKQSIEKCIRKYDPDVESMEGAAIFTLCISRGINFQCLRSISNFVEPRNHSAWDIETSLLNLTSELNRILSVIRK